MSFPMTITCKLVTFCLQKRCRPAPSGATQRPAQPKQLIHPRRVFDLASGLRHCSVWKLLNDWSLKIQLQGAAARQTQLVNLTWLLFFPSENSWWARGRKIYAGMIGSNESLQSSFRSNCLPAFSCVCSNYHSCQEPVCSMQQAHNPVVCLVINPETSLTQSLCCMNVCFIVWCVAQVFLFFLYFFKFTAHIKSVFGIWHWCKFCGFFCLFR